MKLCLVKNKSMVANPCFTSLLLCVTETSGRLDLVAAAEGLGGMEDFIASVVPRLPMHIAMLLWFPESMVGSDDVFIIL